jgi:hypothetical protein
LVRRAASGIVARMPGMIVRLHITLLDIDPPIWRRLELPANFTLARLHDAIQRAFGWQDYHLHEFKIAGVRYGMPSPEDADFGRKIEDERKITLEALARQDIRTFGYVYDFGDDWQVAIVVESAAPAHAKAVYPRVVGGARAGAPEDCGGPWGYAELLEAIADEDHERHEELSEWAGADFDPENFDQAAINKALAKLAPRQAAKSAKRKS